VNDHHDHPAVSDTDAWGAALRDHMDGHAVPIPTLDVEDGPSVPAYHPEWFFRDEPEWSWWERQLVAEVTAGPVLDLGAGAGRVALHLQGRGLAVTAVDASPGAVEVCRRRGVHDVRLGDLADPPVDRRWQAILLLCGNLGLGGSWEGNRRLLRRLAAISAPGAVLVGDSVDGGPRPEIRLRIRHGQLVGEWWSQRNVAADEVPALVRDTGWGVERHVVDGDDHGVLLRRSDEI
jgi:SAM-dependent methyltransferase